MVGAAVKGISKILRKTGKKPVRRSKKYEEALKKRPRGTPTKAGLVHKRNLLRGDEPATKKDTYLSRRATLAGVNRFGVTDKEKEIAKTSLGIGAITGAAAGYIAGKKGIEDRKSTKTHKDKLKKSLEKHKKRTKEQKEKRKKR